MANDINIVAEFKQIKSIVAKEGHTIYIAGYVSDKGLYVPLYVYERLSAHDTPNDKTILKFIGSDVDSGLLNRSTDAVMRKGVVPAYVTRNDEFVRVKTEDDVAVEVKRFCERAMFEKERLLAVHVEDTDTTIYTAIKMNDDGTHSTRTVKGIKSDIINDIKGYSPHIEYHLVNKKIKEIANDDRNSGSST